MSWRDSLRPASFRGAQFRVDLSAKAGGRRGQSYEFPKRDTPQDEDLGRRAKRFSVAGWVVGEDYLEDAARLEAALTAEGPGQLVRPLGGSHRVRCETYTRTERRTDGGLAFFDMSFVEAPGGVTRVAEATQPNVAAKADAAKDEAAKDADKGAASSTPAPVPTPAEAPLVSTISA